MPADPTQLIFLAGVICLMVARRSSWNLTKLYDSARSPFPDGTFAYVLVWLTTFAILLTLASCAGYFACFLRVKPRVIVATVVAPVVVSFGGIGYVLYACFRPVRSFLQGPQTGPGLGEFVHWFGANLRNFPTGLDLAALGLALCAIFLSRVAFGISALPLTLAGNQPRGEEVASWRDVKLAIFLLIGPQFLAVRICSSALYLLHQRVTFSYFYFDIAWTVMAEFLRSAVFLGIPMLLLGRTAWELAKGSLKLPRMGYLALGLVIPAMISALIAAIEYLIQCVTWAAQRIPGLEAPRIDSYVVLKNLNQPELLLICVGAFGEEIVHRGILLPLLVQRYRLHRAVFFTGLIWAAGHLPLDAYGSSSVPQVFLAVLRRFLMCMAMNYVLAWMTLRANSVIPAGLAHTLSNVFLEAKVVHSWWGARDSRWALWAILAYMLWRYWPISEGVAAVAEETEPAIAGLDAEPAV
jgi:membrane protease YdiL (CAAX protease family)